MTLEYLIINYGYLALFLGTCLEGETIMVLGGIAARQGYLELPWVMLVGFAGSILGDQTIFFLGRWKGQSFLARRPHWQPRIDRINRQLERRAALFITSFRFFYGLRNVTPFVLGASSVATPKFVMLNILGGIVWAVTLGGMGYLLGAVAEQVLKDLRIVILGAAALAAGVWVVRHLLRRRDRGSAPTGSA